MQIHFPDPSRGPSARIFEWGCKPWSKIPKSHRAGISFTDRVLYCFFRACLFCYLFLVSLISIIHLNVKHKRQFCSNDQYIFFFRLIIYSTKHRKFYNHQSVCLGSISARGHFVTPEVRYTTVTTPLQLTLFDALRVWLGCRWHLIKGKVEPNQPLSALTTQTLSYKFCQLCQHQTMTHHHCPLSAQCRTFLSFF